MRGKIVAMITFQGCIVVAYECGELWVYNPDTFNWTRLTDPPL